jgi:hypothetical protein
MMTVNAAGAYQLTCRDCGTTHTITGTRAFADQIAFEHGWHYGFDRQGRPVAWCHDCADFNAALAAKRSDYPPARRPASNAHTRSTLIASRV